MDEAERCHRIAILDHGALVADGTPDDLTTALEGRTVLVDAAEPRQAQKVLVDVPGVLSVAQIGNSLRVLTDRNGDAAARIRGVLEEAGLQAGVDASQPNLERSAERRGGKACVSACRYRWSP